MFTLNAEKHYSDNRGRAQSRKNAQPMLPAARWWDLFKSSEHPQNPVRIPLTLSSKKRAGNGGITVLSKLNQDRTGPKRAGPGAGRHKSKSWNDCSSTHLETFTIIYKVCIFKSSCYSSPIFAPLLKKQEERITKMLVTSNKS